MRKNERRLKELGEWIFSAVVGALKFYGAFKGRWQQTETEMVTLLERYFPLTIAYYACPGQWRHRLRTINLSESLFRNLWRFMGRFPGFQDEEHT